MEYHGQEIFLERKIPQSIEESGNAGKHSAWKQSYQCQFECPLPAAKPLHPSNQHTEREDLQQRETHPGHDKHHGSQHPAHNEKKPFAR